MLGDTVESSFASEQPGTVSYTFWVGSGLRGTRRHGQRDTHAGPAG